MKRNEIVQLAKELMTKHGLIEQGWTFGFHTRRKKSLGVCRYNPKTITLLEYYADNEGLEKIKNTILHEIAHALVGPGHHHNKIWKAKAIEIGCNGDRCSKTEYIHPDRKVIKRREKLLYIGTCPGCGGQKKAGKKFNISCGACDKNYNPEFKIVWEVWNKK